MKKIRSYYEIELWEQILWMIFGIVYYRFLLFIPLQNHSMAMSLWIIIHLNVMVTIIGKIIRCNSFTTGKNTFADISIGLGCYTIMVYYAYYKKWILGLLIVAILLSLLYFVYVFSVKIKGRRIGHIPNKKQRTRIIKKRLFKWWDATTILLGITLTVMTLPMLYNRMFHNGMLMAHTSKIAVDVHTEENDAGLVANISTIKKIRDNDTWMQLSTEEKLEVLQVICNCEEKHLGIDYKISVVMDELTNESVMAQYNNKFKQVILNRWHVEQSSAKEVLNSCLHEMYHAWQYCLVDLYLQTSESQKKMMIFDKCEQYIEEMTNYKNSDDDMESLLQYYGQSMEEDSRAYAEETVYIYYNKIDRVLEANTY